MLKKKNKGLLLNIKYFLGMYFKKVCQVFLIALRFDSSLLTVLKKNNLLFGSFLKKLFFVKVNVHQTLLGPHVLQSNNISSFFFQKKKNITEQRLIQKVYLLQENELSHVRSFVNTANVNSLQTAVVAELVAPILEENLINFASRVKKQNSTYYEYFCCFYSPVFSRTNLSFEILHSMDYLSFNLFGASFFFDFYIDKKFESGKFSFFNYFDQSSTSVNGLNYFLTKSTSVNVETIFLFLQTLYVQNNFIKCFEYLEVNYFNQKYLTVLNMLLLTTMVDKKSYLSSGAIITNVTTQVTFIPYLWSVNKFLQKKYYLFLYFGVVNFIFAVICFNFAELFFFFFYLMSLGCVVFFSRFLLQSYTRVLRGGKKNNTKIEVEQFFFKSYAFTQYDDFIFFQQEFLSLARQQNFEKEADIRASWDFMQNTLSGTNFFAQPFLDIAFLEKHFFYLYQLTILDYFDSYYNTTENLEYNAKLTLPDEGLLANYILNSPSDIKEEEIDTEFFNELVFEEVDADFLPTELSRGLLAQTYQDPLDQITFWMYLIESNDFFSGIQEIEEQESGDASFENGDGVVNVVIKLREQKSYVSNIDGSKTLVHSYQNEYPDNIIASFQDDYEDIFSYTHRRVKSVRFASGKTMGDSKIFLLSSSVLASEFLKENLIFSFSYFSDFFPKNEYFFLDYSVLASENNDAIIEHLYRESIVGGVGAFDILGENFHPTPNLSFKNTFEANLAETNNFFYFTSYIDLVAEREQLGILLKKRNDVYYQTSYYNSFFFQQLYSLLTQFVLEFDIHTSADFIKIRSGYFGKDLLYSTPYSFGNGVDACLSWDSFLYHYFLVQENNKVLIQYQRHIYKLVSFELIREKNFYFRFYNLNLIFDQLLKKKSKKKALLALSSLYKLNLVPNWVFEDRFFGFELQNRVRRVYRYLGFKYLTKKPFKKQNNFFFCDVFSGLDSQNNDFIVNSVFSSIWLNLIDYRIILSNNFSSPYLLEFDFLKDNNIQNMLNHLNNNILLIDFFFFKDKIALKKLVKMQNFLVYSTFDFTAGESVNLKTQLKTLYFSICYDFEYFLSSYLFRHKNVILNSFTHQLFSIDYMYYIFNKYGINFLSIPETKEEYIILLKFLMFYDNMHYSDQNLFARSNEYRQVKNLGGQIEQHSGVDFSAKNLFSRADFEFDLQYNVYKKTTKIQIRDFLLHENMVDVSYRLSLLEELPQNSNTHYFLTKSNPFLVQNAVNTDYFVNKEYLIPTYRQTEFLFPLYIDKTFYTFVDYDFNYRDGFFWY